jgi:hypothetical protein
MNLKSSCVCRDFVIFNSAKSSWIPFFFCVCSHDAVDVCLMSIVVSIRPFKALSAVMGAERAVLLIYLILAQLTMLRQLKMNANCQQLFLPTSCSIVYQMTITNVTHSSAIWQTADAPHSISDNLISLPLTAVNCLTAS